MRSFGTRRKRAASGLNSGVSMNSRNCEQMRSRSPERRHCLDDVAVVAGEVMADVDVAEEQEGHLQCTRWTRSASRSIRSTRLRVS
jgi:hypothetical protein